MLIGFLATAYLTLLLVIIYYLMGFIDARYTNNIDAVVINKLSPRTYLGQAKRLETTLRRVIVTFSDQQAATGIALLSSGFAQLSSGIDSYHWQILVYLVWFSSLTHLTTLTVLRQYFLHNPAARLGRAVLMLITVTMLGAALLPTGNNIWFYGNVYHAGPLAAAPAICYFQRLGSSKSFEIGSPGGISMIISIAVLASGYLTRMIQLSNHATAVSHRWLKEKPRNFLQKLLDHAAQRSSNHASGSYSVYWKVDNLILEILFVWLKALLDIYSSMIWEVCIFFLSFIRLSYHMCPDKLHDLLACIRSGLGNSQSLRCSKL